MKKYITALLVFIICFFTLGCGELTFDDIIYTDATETVAFETLQEDYAVANNDTTQLNVKYETKLEIKINDNNYTRDIITIVGDYEKRNIMQIEIACKKNNTLEKTIYQTCYNGEIYTLVKYEGENSDGSNNIKNYLNYNTDVWTKQAMLSAILPTLNEESIEYWYQKTFEDVSYTKYAMYWNKINPEFSEVKTEEELIATFDENLLLATMNSAGEIDYSVFGFGGLDFNLPDTYITNYYVEYGIKSGAFKYVSMFRKEYKMMNKENNIYGSVKSTTLLTAYGQEVNSLISFPADSESYKPIPEPPVGE